MPTYKRSTSPGRLFTLHPVYQGIKAGAYARLEIAMRLACSPQKKDAHIPEIKQLFREGRELLSWLLSPLEDRERSEVIVRVVERGLKLPNLSAEQKVELIQAAPKRSRGRPSELKLLAVYALEVKLAKPEATWKEITDHLCPCPKQAGHNACCVENIESEVKRLKYVLRRMSLVPLIIADTKDRILKTNLKEMFGQKG